MHTEISELSERKAVLEIERDTALLGLGTALDVPGLYPKWQDFEGDALTSYLITNGTRLSQVGWGSNLHDYIVTTLVHGRPGSANVWPNSGGGMVSWSQLGGGPLRQDQIEDIASYILNWDKGEQWSVADIGLVRQFGKPLADASQMATDRR